VKGAEVPLPVVSRRLGELVCAKGSLPVRDVAAFLLRLGYPAERVRQVLAGAEAVVEERDGTAVVVPAPLPTLEVVHGDAVAVMAAQPSESFDVILCDPPYSSGSTKEAGKTWRPAVDRMSRSLKGHQDEWFGGDSLSAHGMQVFLHICAVEWFRLLKPGGHVLRSLLSVVCPPGGRVLDPFCGSGSTGEAAGARGPDHTGTERWVGASFLGVERERKYAEGAQARMARVLAGLHDVAPSDG